MPEPLPGASRSLPASLGRSWRTSRDVGHANLRSLPTSPVEATAHPIDAWLTTFSNATTIRNYGGDIRRLFATTRAANVGELTDGMILQWAVGEGRSANNTVRARLTAAMSFLRWCRENELPALDPGRIARLARRYPKTYGKVQTSRPARWLTRDDAYGRLVAACQDGTELGLRDELAIRLGLAGIRAAEIGSLRVGDVDLTRSPAQINWTGKGRRPRTATAGREMLAAIRRYLHAYAENLDRPLTSADPLLCRRVRGGRATTGLAWGQGWADPAASVWDSVTRRAVIAGLGHVAPHDLRRTAAGILHRAVNEQGAHFFDLLDIQKVLGHADPATTMKSYLDPMDTDVYDRAASYLD